jgi:hypothetical protein
MPSASPSGAIPRGPAKRRNIAIVPYGIGGKAEENLKAAMK